MTRQRVCGVLVIALMAAVPAGCGSDDNSSSGDNAPTKAEFLKQGNAVCKKGNEAIDKQGKELFGGKEKPTPAEQKKFATDVLIP
jgi:hypothetical protein